MSDDRPGMPHATRQHWHELLTTAAATDEAIAVVPVESLLDLLYFAANAAEVLHEAGLDDVATSETARDVRALGRHLAVVRDERPHQDEA